MIAVRLVSAGLLVSLMAAGQAVGGRGGGRQGTQPAAIASPELVQELYQRAKRAALAAPELAAPREVAVVANDEMRMFPSQGLADFTAAYNLARAIRPPESADDVAGQAREAIKADTEQRAVSELAMRDEPEQALALTRLADVPKAPLYDQLILAAERSGAMPPGRGRGRGSPQGIASGSQASVSARLDEVTSLVDECMGAGSYPYTGVAMVLRRPGGAGLEQMLLVQDGYQWAGDETEPTTISRALIFLQAGHRAEPELDGALESTLVTLIQRLGQNPAETGVFATGRSAGTRLLALLTQLDPARAQALALQFPAIGALPQVQSSSGNVTLSVDGTMGDQDVTVKTIQDGDLITLGSAAGAPVVFKFGTALGSTLVGSMEPSAGIIVFNPSVPGTDAADDPGPAEADSASKFRALLAQAEGLQRSDPSQALSLASQASSLLDDTLWATQTSVAAALAFLESNLGNHNEANRLLSRALDEADRQAAAVDATYANADSNQQARMAEEVESAQPSVFAVYSLAARLDFTTAAERAEAAQFVLLKSMVLARVALVGEVGQPPVR